jgi:hypothetical protein
MTVFFISKSLYKKVTSRYPKLNPINKLESEQQASQTKALLPLLSKKLISTTNKLFRSASNTF